MPGARSMIELDGLDTEDLRCAGLRRASDDEWRRVWLWLDAGDLANALAPPAKPAHDPAGPSRLPAGCAGSRRKRPGALSDPPAAAEPPPAAPPPAAWPPRYLRARDLAGVVFPVSEAVILHEARKAGIGRKLGRAIVFSPQGSESGLIWLNRGGPGGFRRAC